MPPNPTAPLGEMARQFANETRKPGSDGRFGTKTVAGRAGNTRPGRPPLKSASERNCGTCASTTASWYLTPYPWIF